MNSMTLHTLQRFDYWMFCNAFHLLLYTKLQWLNFSYFAMDSIALRALQGFGYRFFLQWVLLLYTYDSDRVITCFAMNSIANTCGSDWVIASVCDGFYWFTHMPVIRSHTLQWWQWLGYRSFATDSATLHTLQWLDHRAICNESHCFAHYSDWIVAFVLQWALLLYKYYSDWVMFFFSRWVLLVYTYCSDRAIAFLQWISLLYAHYSAWIIVCFCCGFHYFTHIAVTGL